MTTEEKKEELYILLQKYVPRYYTCEREDLIHSVYLIFLERDYLDKFDPNLSSFATFVKRYSSYIAGNIISHKIRKRINTVEIVEGHNDIDNTSPLDNFIKEKCLEEVNNYFSEDEIDLLCGYVSSAELGRKLCVSRQTVHARLKKRIKDFNERNI